MPAEGINTGVFKDIKEIASGSAIQMALLEGELQKRLTGTPAPEKVDTYLHIVDYVDVKVDCFLLLDSMRRGTSHSRVTMARYFYRSTWSESINVLCALLYDEDERVRSAAVLKLAAVLQKNNYEIGLRDGKSLQIVAAIKGSIIKFGGSCFGETTTLNGIGIVSEFMDDLSHFAVNNGFTKSPFRSIIENGRKD
jgi:hypothetical protein